MFSGVTTAIVVSRAFAVLMLNVGFLDVSNFGYRLTQIIVGGRRNTQRPSSRCLVELGRHPGKWSRWNVTGSCSVEPNFTHPSGAQIADGAGDFGLQRRRDRRCDGL